MTYLKTGKDLRDHLFQPFSVWEKSSGSQYMTTFSSSKVSGLNCSLSILHGHCPLLRSPLKTILSELSVNCTLSELSGISHLAITVAKYHSCTNFSTSHFAAGEKVGWVISSHLTTAVISWRTSENHLLHPVLHAKRKHQ